MWACPARVKSLAYTSLVRPILEYAATVWDPYTNKDKDKLERVQNSRFCTNNYNMDASVTKMKTDLQWTSLEDRRKMSRLCMMYKMKNNKLVDVPTDKYLIPAQKRTRNSHAFRYQRFQPRIDVFKNSYFPRTIVDWNFYITKHSRGIFSG